MTHRFERVVEGADPAHNFWVLAPPHGAVSVWFSPVTLPILGHSVCNGAVVHSTTPREGWIPRESCEFMEVPCWYAPQSMLHLAGPMHAYDHSDYDTVYEWLEHYLELLVEP